MAPRKYRMGKRAEAVARTRVRIVDAAMALYQEQPVSSTSMQDVARRADVAPGTVLNHFASTEALVEAVLAELVRRLEAPSSAIFEGSADVAERLGALALALARFYERASPWFRVHERERDQVPAFADAAGRFNAHVDRMIREALGAGATERSVSVARALLAPSVFGSLRAHGALTTEAAAALATEIVVAWLDTRAEEA